MRVFLVKANAFGSSISIQTLGSLFFPVKEEQNFKSMTNVTASYIFQSGLLALNSERNERFKSFTLLQSSYLIMNLFMVFYRWEREHT